MLRREVYKALQGASSLKQRSIFINVPCHLSPGVLDRVQVRWTRQMMQKKNVISLEKFVNLQAVWIAALSCWKIYSSPHKRAPSVKSDDRSNIQMYPAAFWRPYTTCSSIVPRSENAPHTMIEPPSLCLVEKVSGGISYSCQYRWKQFGPSMLKNIYQRMKLFHFSTSNAWWFLEYSNLPVLWRWWRCFKFLKPFALKSAFIVHEFHWASMRFKLVWRSAWALSNLSPNPSTQH